MVTAHVSHDPMDTAVQNKCVHKHIIMRVYVYVYVYICVCIYMYMCMCMYMYMYVYVYIYVYDVYTCHHRHQHGRHRHQVDCCLYVTTRLGPGTRPCGTGQADFLMGQVKGRAFLPLSTLFHFPLHLARASPIPAHHAAHHAAHLNMLEHARATRRMLITVHVRTSA
jgi:hypothetical protein